MSAARAIAVRGGRLERGGRAGRGGTVAALRVTGGIVVRGVRDAEACGARMALSGCFDGNGGRLVGPATGVRARNCLSTRSFNTQIPCHTCTSRTQCPASFPRSAGPRSLFVCIAPSGTQAAFRPPDAGRKMPVQTPIVNPQWPVAFHRVRPVCPWLCHCHSGATGKHHWTVSHPLVTHSLTMFARLKVAISVMGHPIPSQMRDGSLPDRFSRPSPAPVAPDTDQIPDGLSRTCEILQVSASDMLDTSGRVLI